MTCRLPDGETFGAGMSGTREMLRDVLAMWRAYPGCYKSATVRFFGYTPAGKPRFGVVKALYTERGRD